MRRNPGTVSESLAKAGLLKSDQIERVEAEMKAAKEPFHKVVRRLGLMDDKQWVDFLSSHLGIPRVEISHYAAKPDIVSLVPEELIRKFEFFPLMKVGKRLTVAVNDPSNLAMVDQIRLRTGFEVDLVLATETEIRSAIEQHCGWKSEMSRVVESVKSDEKTKTPISTSERREIPADETPAVKLINAMFAQAVRDSASDIHVAPEKDVVLVRCRVDGMLREMERYPKTLHASVVSRIKLLANLDITENRIPQDGKIRSELGNHTLDLRISIMPTVHGENVVIRLLNTQSAFMPIEGLGMTGDRLEQFREIITKPYGIVLITGATGSGKTTTLYAALNQINTMERNIITIEDPVEYQLPLVRQIQVNPKVNLTFATGLRSILRQDPDVIMVGEIRDKETAAIAIQAALTGHMVFSTLHTNHASSAITRLLDMGVEPFLITSTVVGIVAQRLIRTICSECREKLVPNEEEKACLRELVGSDHSDSTELFRGKGCLYCKKTGYRGRAGLFEILIPDEAIKSLTLKRASAQALEEAALRSGMCTLRHDGIQKMKSGVTTVGEVFRATQE